MMRKAFLTAAVLGSAALVSACSSDVKAPYDPGVCFVVQVPDAAEAKGGKKAEVQFQRLADNQPQMEACAARLEEMRLRFLGMGGNRRELVGSYQGNFIFIDRAGVWQSQSLNGNRYFALARTGDGRLAVPGAIERAPEPVTPPAKP